MHQLAEGEAADPVQLRDKDHWQELARDINRVIQRGVASRSDETGPPCIEDESPEGTTAKSEAMSLPSSPFSDQYTDVSI